MLAPPTEEVDIGSMRSPQKVAVLAACLLAGCVNVTPPGILVASSPPGARILVDGKDSGFITPCNLAVSDQDHWIELMLDGYATTALRIEENTRREVVPWSEGIVRPPSWPFPLFLPARDLFTPFRTNDSPLPSRIFVELRLAAAE